MAAAALAIRARSTGLVVGDITTAVAERSVAVTWSLRGTRHLHAVEDVGWIRSLMEPVFNRPTARDRELGSAGVTGERDSAGACASVSADGCVAGPFPVRNYQHVVRVPHLPTAGIKSRDAQITAPVTAIHRRRVSGDRCESGARRPWP